MSVSVHLVIVFYSILLCSFGVWVLQETWHCCIELPIPLLAHSVGSSCPSDYSRLCNIDRWSMESLSVWVMAACDMSIQLSLKHAFPVLGLDGFITISLVVITCIYTMNR